MSLGPASEFSKASQCLVGGGGGGGGGSSRSLVVTLQKEISAEFSGIETVVLKTSVLIGQSKTAIWLLPFSKAGVYKRVVFAFSQIQLLCSRPHTPWRGGCSSCRGQPQTARLWCGRSAGTGRNTWSALRGQVWTHNYLI